MTVSAPRSRAMCAMSRSVRTANESMTSSAVTSTMTPRARKRPTRSISASRSCDRSASVSADCMDAIRYWPCLRIGTSTAPSATGVGASSRLRGQLFQRQDLVAEQPLRFLDAALQVAYRRHLAQVDADRDKRLGDLQGDRKSTRLNSSHGYISYAVFCLKKKKSPQQTLFLPRLLDPRTPALL